MSPASKPDWKDYELLDSGFGEKLERFGEYILIRPEPQALWPKSGHEKDWLKSAHARFVRDNNKKSHRLTDNKNSGWTFFKNIPENWTVNYEPLGLKLKLACTSFGHLGIFPEQVSNWHFIHDQVSSFSKKPSVLNLFAYTGASSIVAAKSGADVTHLDAVKQVVNWANENKSLSRSPEIRWLVEDAFKYVKKESSRGKSYQGIIIDPPAYGRGPSGEKWVLEELINELLHYCSLIADPSGFFILLNLYSMGLSGTVGSNLLKAHFKKNAMSGECIIPAKSGFPLPLCTWIRITKDKD